MQRALKKQVAILLRTFTAKLMCFNIILPLEAQFDINCDRNPVGKNIRRQGLLFQVMFLNLMLDRLYFCNDWKQSHEDYASLTLRLSLT